MQKMKIYLIGYMGAGKSRFGRLLAERTGLKFIDLDDLFEEHYHIGISDFFEKYGEPVFRKLEHDILHSTADFENCVISTGGGTPCFHDGMAFIKGNGISVYLKLDLDTLFIRLKSVKKKRPLISGMSDPELLRYIEKQLRERERDYLEADFIINGLNPENSQMDQLLSLLGVSS
jgi:shikimate kinase